MTSDQITTILHSLNRLHSSENNLLQNQAQLSITPIIARINIISNRQFLTETLIRHLLKTDTQQQEEPCQEKCTTTS